MFVKIIQVSNPNIWYCNLTNVIFEIKEEKAGLCQDYDAADSTLYTLKYSDYNIRKLTLVKGIEFSRYFLRRYSILGSDFIEANEFSLIRKLAEIIRSK